MTELNRIRVLLADDNKAMLSLVTKLLTANCYVVGEMSDGRQALKAVKELKPDILVLDISMPVMNGIETAQRLRQEDSHRLPFGARRSGICEGSNGHRSDGLRDQAAHGLRSLGHYQ